MPGTLYVGKAGELASRSEFLLSGRDVAVPDVDVGADFFLVRDPTGVEARVQIKTALGKQTRYGWKAQFLVPLEQVYAPTRPLLVFVFALRRTIGEWEFLVIPQDHLRRECEARQLGCEVKGKLHLYVSFRPATVICSGVDLQRYRNNFDLAAYF